MFKFQISKFLNGYKKNCGPAPVAPSYSMYYIFRFWGKLQSLRKYLHFNISVRSKILNNLKIQYTF